MKASKALYISKTRSTHDERFVEAFCELTPLDEIYLDEASSFINRDNFFARNLVFAGPLSTGVSSIPIESNARIIGICMAFEINEESKKDAVFIEIYRNIQRCVAIICDCQKIEKELRSRFEYKGPILRIAYGCNQEDFLDIEFQNWETPRIVSTRDWTTIHSNETSLQALYIAKINGLEFEARYFGAGEELTDDLKMRTRMTFQNAISFHGSYRLEELPKILSESEIYISTSISDGTSVSLLEAMSAGRICVVRDFASNREWIEHGNNGFLFSTPEELSDLLLWISNLSFEEKIRISDVTRSSVIGRGDWRVMRKALVEFSKNWIAP